MMKYSKSGLSYNITLEIFVLSHVELFWLIIFVVCVTWSWRYFIKLELDIKYVYSSSSGRINQTFTSRGFTVDIIKVNIKRYCWPW